MNPNTPNPTPAPQAPLDLTQLDCVQLGRRNADLLRLMELVSRGPEPWRDVKRRAFRSVLALGELAGRTRVTGMDPVETLHVELEMDCAVPLRDAATGVISAGSGVRLALSYPREAMSSSLAGSAFVTILAPDNVWLPNLSPGSSQLCLAGRIPAGTPLVRLILLAYGSLTLQLPPLDISDSNGVFNPAAALDYAQPAMRARMPLSREPFLRTTAGKEGA